MHPDKHIALKEVIAKLQAGGKPQLRKSWADIKANHPTLMTALQTFKLTGPQRESNLNRIAFPIIGRSTRADTTAALAAGNTFTELEALANGRAYLERNAVGNYLPKEKTGAGGYQLQS